MNHASPLVTKKSLALSAIAALGACAACCALPMLAAVGLGGGVVSAVAAYVRPGADLLLAGVVGLSVLGVLAFRARARRAASCDTSCEVDRGCGCAPTTKLLATPSPRQGEPILCTANLANKPTVQGQLDGYRAAFQALLRTERFPGGVRWVFAKRPGLEAELRLLAENEHQCCRFFQFDLVLADDTIVWETTALPEAGNVLEEYARLPELLAAGVEASAVKQAFDAAGLRFADATD
jgi:hypothetical protein